MCSVRISVPGMGAHGSVQAEACTVARPLVCGPVSHRHGRTTGRTTNFHTGRPGPSRLPTLSRLLGWIRVNPRTCQDIDTTGTQLPPQAPREGSAHPRVTNCPVYKGSCRVRGRPDTASVAGHPTSVAGRG